MLLPVATPLATADLDGPDSVGQMSMHAPAHALLCAALCSLEISTI